MSKKIIKSLGGVQAVAAHLKVAPTTVYYWKQQNYIPIKRQPEILSLAKNLNIALDPADFVNTGEDSAAPRTGVE